MVKPAPLNNQYALFKNEEQDFKMGPIWWWV
jgi:hypothetical protein